jgi:hypothetical protein
MSIAIASDFTNHPKVVVLEAQQLRKPNPNPDIISKHFEITILRLSLRVYCTLWWASAISMEWYGENLTGPAMDMRLPGSSRLFEQIALGSRNCDSRSW